MIIQSRLKDYEVIFEQGLEFLQALQKTPNALFVLDRKVWDLYQPQFAAIPTDRLVLIDATEENKVIDTALSICEKITAIPAKRNATLISVGGGIIQDLTGFTANITYRGIHWIFVPTTLLAACDSCIGGKTSLNYKRYKNLLGTFYPPDVIHICPAFFATLTDRDYRSGLGEVVKFNLMTGEPGLRHMEEDLDKLLARRPETVRAYVDSSLRFKKPFIEADEFDRGERIKLNFAHTFGHAIEVVTRYEIPHGTAVAIGMIMANSVSVARGLMDPVFAARAEKVLRRVIQVDPALLQGPMEDFLAAMHKDKKQVSDSLTAVLMVCGPEGTELRLVPDLQPAEVSRAVAHFTDGIEG